MKEDDSPKQLVRSFSSDLESRADPPHHNELQRILIGGSAQEQRREQVDENWRIYFEPWRPSAQERKDLLLGKEATELNAAWKKFRERLPSNEQAEFERRAPTMQDVIQTVDDVSSAWQDKRRKGKTRYFHKMCEMLNSHSVMLELLPSGSEYVSLVAGTLKSIVKASANHEKIVAGMSKALGKIADTVAGCERICSIYSTKEVQMRIAELYKEIFGFLQASMHWYLDKYWKRILNSFREDFYEQFEDYVDHINSVALKVRDQASLGHYAEVRTIRQGIERIEHQAMKEEYQRKLLTLEEPERLKTLGDFIYSNIKDFLIERAQGYIEQQATAGADHSRIDNVPAIEATSVTPATTPIPGREEVLLSSRHMESFFYRDRVRIDFDPAAVVTVPNSVSVHLQTFITNPETAVLAISGPDRLDSFGLSVMTKVAAAFIEFTNRARLPVISYFCELRREETLHDGETAEVRALVQCVYALIRQLIELLPLLPKDRSLIDLNELEKLDGSYMHIEKALDVLKTLRNAMQTILFVVIDDLQWLDDSTTHEYIVSLVRIMEGEEDEPRSSIVLQLEGPRIKTLMTTSGRSRALLDALEFDEYLLVDEDWRGRGGQALEFD